MTRRTRTRTRNTRQRYTREQAVELLWRKRALVDHALDLLVKRVAELRAAERKVARADREAARRSAFDDAVDAAIEAEMSRQPWPKRPRRA